MNVRTELKCNAVEINRELYQRNSINAAAAMMHVSGDFNLGTLIRSANFFGFKEVIYVGGKKSYDRRSTVGTHHYIPVNFIRTEEEFINTYSNKYSIISVENNINRKTYNLLNEGRILFKYLSKPPLFIFGEEQQGLSNFVLDNSNLIATIPAFGTVPSLNVGSCASIVMALYRSII